MNNSAINTELQKIVDAIYSHLSPVYPKSSKSVFGAIIYGIAYCIYLVKNSVDAIRDNVFYRTAQGPTIIGVRATVDMPGVQIRVIDDNYPAGMYSLEYNRDHRKIRIIGKPWVYLGQKPDEYNLSTEDLLFMVYVDPSKLPAVDTKKLCNITPKYTPDYLGEIARNRGIERRDNETDVVLTNRCRAVGQKITKHCLARHLAWLLGTDNFQTKEYRETFESWMIPGCSFLNYSSVPGGTPIGQMQELYFGSYYIQRSSNTYHVSVIIPAGVATDIPDDLIKNECQKVLAGGVECEVRRTVA